MRSDVFEKVTDRRNQVLWVILAAQAGFMNTGGFLACHRFVSHMTGYGTHVGVALGEGDYLYAFEMSLAPLCFLAGAAYSGWLVDRRLILGREPWIHAGIITVTVMNLMIYFAAAFGLIGEFGEPLVLQRDFLLLFCLCFACGVQNGLFTGLTKGMVRTTHLTGPTTDIGLNLVKVFAYDRGDPRRDELAAANWLRVKIVIAFSAGAMVATNVFSFMRYEGFAIPCLISLFLVWYIDRLLRVVAAPEPPRVALAPTEARAVPVGR